MAEAQSFLANTDQISLEKAILNHILSTGNSQLLLEMQLKDIQDTYFVEETHRKIYQYMKKYYADTKFIPEPALIEDTFANFFWLETKYNVQNHIEELIFRWEKRITTEKMSKALMELKDDKIPTHIFQDIISTLSTPRSWKKITGFIESAKEFKEKYVHEMKNKEIFDKWIKTWIKDFDDMTGGIQQTDYIWILAREWVGKTIFNLWLSYNAMKQWKNVVYFSPEMSEDQIKQRLFLIHNNFNTLLFKNKSLTEEDLIKWDESILNMEKDFCKNNTNLFSELYIVDDIPENNFSMKTIWAKVERYNQIIKDKIKAQFDEEKYKNFIDQENFIDLIVIDWFHIMKPSEAITWKESWEKWKAISNQIKSYALQNKIPVITSFHANRGSEEKLAPDMYNAALTDSIGRDLDVWFSLFRTDMMKQAKFLGVSIIKIRDGSPFNFLMQWDLDNYKIAYAKKIGSLEAEAEKLWAKTDDKDGWRKKSKKEEWEEDSKGNENFLDKFKEKDPKEKKKIIKKEEPISENPKEIETPIDTKNFVDTIDEDEVARELENSLANM